MASLGRLERNRELIEKSAALLAADLPVDVLIERLCLAIATALQATCRVTLPNADGSARVTLARQRENRATTREELLGGDSRVARVLASGRASLARSAADWEPGEAENVLSAVYVPVQYGDAILGVLGVEHPDAKRFERDDLRLLEAVARYLGIAIRNQRALSVAALPVRYPWYAVVMVFVLALLGTIAIAMWTRGRAEDVAARAAAVQQARANRIAESVAPLLQDDATYAHLVAGIVGPVDGDPALVDVLLARLLETSPAGVHGVGVFYAPRAFRGAQRPFATYVHRGDANVAATQPYLSQPWYVQAVEHSGNGVIIGPRMNGRNGFLTAAVAFFRDGDVRGVAAVDTTAASVVQAVTTSAQSDDWVAIEDANGQAVLSLGTPPAGDARRIATPLKPSEWTLVLVSPRSGVEADVRATIAWGIGLSLSIWALALAAFGLLNVLHHTRRDAVGLKLQRAELQSEIATRIDAEERLRSAAYHDALTGLPNRAFFLDQLAEVLDNHDAGRGEYAVLFIDLDRFYVVNDTFGHTVGDALLRAIAERLEEVLPPHALVARLGGDEFVLLLPSAGSATRESVAIAEDVLEALRNPFSIEGREVYSGASIGIVRITDSYASPEAVLRDADLSMFHAKRAGRANYAIFDRSMRDRVTHQLELEGGLRGAVERNEIVAQYQPIVRVSDGMVAGFEALARWDRDGLGTFVSATEFIGVAEQTGMLRAIDAELFSQVCRDARELRTIDPALRLSVNVSANDLTRASLLADIDATLQRFDLEPSVFKLEITETALMEDADRALAMLGELRSRGFEITIDDFGVGYSSLSYLQRLPISGVKIDRSFILALPADGQALEIARAIVALAKTLGLAVTAEGVERRDQLKALADIGVDYVQGYWFSPAVSFEAAQTFLHEHRRTAV